jgi:CrcB protein
LDSEAHPRRAVSVKTRIGNALRAHIPRWQRPLVLRVLWIGVFGFIGTIARYAAQGAVQRLSGGTFPYGTLAVNVVGSFIVGCVATLALERSIIGPAWRPVILVGFCGGVTTYSAVAYETFELLRTGDLLRGLASVALQLGLGLVAVWLGYAAAMKL